ncbi:MAG: undecaprenyldiphospho-muramoylpentapeptide beta-N-acetylglucosaminyltransferase [Bacteroidota bacterium]
MDNYNIILSGGGTGGHIYPAVAIANAFKQRHPQAKVLFVGAKDKMEMEKVPKAGYPIKGLWISGLQRKLTVKNLLFPFKVLHSLVKSFQILKDFKPDVAVGTGGFASGPLLWAAAVKGVPCVLQEQNSYAGITNKLLANKAKKICVAYENMDRYFPKSKIVKTGNPVRSDLVATTVDRKAAFSHIGLNEDQPVLLVLGGSLGARRINQLIESKLHYFEQMGLQLLWQCGKLYYEDYKKYTSTTIKVIPFIDRMEAAYVAADIIISRAGAGSVSELCLIGKPVVFIPSPNVAEDHQAKNARALVSKDAALMILEQDLEADFENVFGSLWTSKAQQQKLAKNMKALALPEATNHIVKEIDKLLASNYSFNES